MKSNNSRGNNGNLDFQVGDRVLLTYEFLQYREEDRQGVIAMIRNFSVEESKGAVFKKTSTSMVPFIVIALDTPMVTRYSPMDEKIADELMIDRNRIYTIKEQSARTFIRKIPIDYDNAKRSTLFRCDCCSRILQFSDLMPFQSFMICKSHICPWNEVYHEPNLAEVGPLYCRIYDIAQRSRLSLPDCCEAKAMVFKSKYDKLVQTMKSEPYKVRMDDLITTFFMDVFGYGKGRGSNPTVTNDSFEITLTIKDNLIIHSLPFAVLQYYLAEEFKGKFNMFRKDFKFPVYSSGSLNSGGNNDIGGYHPRVIPRQRNSAETPAECLVHIKSPFFKIVERERSATCSLRPGATFHDLWDAIEAMPYSFFRQKFHVFAELSNRPLLYGRTHFCIPVEEVKKIDQDHLQHAKGMHQFESSETLEVYREHPIVSPPLQLHALIGDFPHNQPLVAKTVDLADVYIGFRRIKGDGNCYYRAVMFSYLEQLIALSDRAEQLRLIDNFVSRLQESKGDHSRLTQYMRKLQDTPFSLKNFVDDIILLDEGLDLAMVIAAKAILTHYILTHRDEDLSGTSLENLWLAYYGSEDIRTLEDCCEAFIGRLDLSAEGPFVNMGLLFKALGCGGMLVMLDRRVDVPISLVHCPAPDLGDGQPQSVIIHLLLRPGHFDLLYPDLSITVDQLLDRYKPTAVDNSSSSANAHEVKNEEEIPFEAPSDMYLEAVPSCCYELSESRIKVFALWNDRLSESGVCFANGDSLQHFSFAKRLVLSKDMYAAYQHCDPESVFNFPNRRVRFIKWEELRSADFSYVVVMPANCVIVRVEVVMSSSSASANAASQGILCCIDLTKFGQISQLEKALSDHFGRALEVTRPTRSTLLEGLQSHVSVQDEIMSADADILVATKDIELMPTELVEKTFKIPIKCLDQERTVEVSSKVAFDKFVKNVKTAFGVKTSNCQLVVDDSVVVTAGKFPSLLLPHQQDEDGEMRNGPVESVWDLKYCYVCELEHKNGAINSGDCDLGSTFHQLPCCRNNLCKVCLNEIVDSCPAEKLFAKERSGGIPQLVAKISCPRCNVDIPQSVLQYSDRYNDDFTFVLNAPVAPPKVRCALGYLDCADRLLQLDEVVQLGCDHFICHDCLQGSIGTEIAKAKQNHFMICCPACSAAQTQGHTAGSAASFRSCNCHTCTDINIGPHIITSYELKYWMSKNIVDKKVIEDWERINLMVAAKDDPNSVKFDCRCNAIYFISIHGANEEAICPYGCGYKICVKCKAEAHPGINCENNFGGMDMNNWFLRRCEKCEFIGALPKGCFHITCQCSHQYCFLCMAPHLQYLNHDLSYHRPGCDLYQPCCNKDCRKNGKAQCDDAQYKPGPCDACTASNQGNQCQHSNWRACSKCIRENKACVHRCPECKRLGRACDPPSNNKADGTLYDFYKAIEVGAKQKELGDDA